MHSKVTVLCSFTLLLAGTASAICQINLDTPLGSKTPVVLMQSRTVKPENGNGDVTFQDGNEMQFLCSGANNYLIDRAQIGQLSNATCRNNQFTLQANGQTYSFAQLLCRKAPQPAAQEVGICNLNSKKIHLGFQVTPSYFNARIELCFDARKLTTYWSKNILETTPYSCKVGDTTSFKKDFFGNVNPDRIYSQQSIYDKGHLTTRCDFFTGPEKRKTFYYINSGPQIKNFNRKNWKDLEAVIRNGTNQHQKTFYIYSGTTGFVQNLGGSIPVPQYFWKVVIDDFSGKGVAFVGVNDVQQNVANPCLAASICPSILWLGTNFIPKMSDITRGQIYCCTVPMLINIQNIEIPNIPEFRGGVLTTL